MIDRLICRRETRFEQHASKMSLADDHYEQYVVRRSKGALEGDSRRSHRETNGGTVS